MNNALIMNVVHSIDDAFHDTTCIDIREFLPFLFFNQIREAPAFEDFHTEEEFSADLFELINWT